MDLLAYALAKKHSSSSSSDSTNSSISIGENGN